MPVLAFVGLINNGTPQQNSNGVLVGQFNSTGWDANMKFNAAEGGNFGVCTVNIAGLNFMFDNMEMIDGVIGDQDLKPTINSNL